MARVVVSDSDSAERTKDKRVARYTGLGVRERVRFDRAPEQARPVKPEG